MGHYFTTVLMAMERPSGRHIRPWTAIRLHGKYQASTAISSAKKLVERLDNGDLPCYEG